MNSINLMSMQRLLTLFTFLTFILNSSLSWGQLTTPTCTGTSPYTFCSDNIDETGLYISKFELSKNSEVVINDQLASSCANNNIVLFPGTFTIEANSSYSFSIEFSSKTSATTSVPAIAAYRVWIDFNADGDFDDAGESLAMGIPSNSDAGTIIIPAIDGSNVKAGKTRMLVRSALARSDFFRDSDILISSRAQLASNEEIPNTPCENRDMGDIHEYEITIADCSTLAVSVGSQQNIDCTHAKGEVTLSGSGGKSPYEYSLDGTTYQTSTTFSNLDANNYTVYIKDANGCIRTNTFTISSSFPTPTTPTAIASYATCKNESVTITPSASGVTTFKFYSSDPSVSGATLLHTGATYTFSLAATTTVYISSVVGTCESSAISTTITASDCSAKISDPCSCKNNATTLSDGQFTEIIQVDGPTGQTWTVSSVTGLYTTTSAAPPATPTDIAVGTALVEAPAGSGKYVLTGIHIDDIGYSISVTNGGTVLSLTNTCHYPTPVIAVPDKSLYCTNGTTVTLSGSAGSATGTGTFTIAPASTPSSTTVITTFDPTSYALDNYIIKYTFDETDAPGTSSPGCIQSVEKEISLAQPPIVDGNITHPSCPAGTDGSISITITAGNKSLKAAACSDFTVNWSNGATDCLNSGLATGTYTVSVTSAEGCTSTKSFNLVGADLQKPVVTCQNKTVILDATGSASITVNDIKSTASDNCGTPTLSLSKSSFNCSNLGSNTVTLTATTTTATTAALNTASCNATVTVVDNILPVAKCKPTLNIALDASGTYTLTAAEVDNGSTDNCGIQTSTLDITDFDCNYISSNPNTVTLTVADAAGNTATCTSDITVQDLIAPTITCKNATIDLNPTDLTTAIIPLTTLFDNLTENTGCYAVDLSNDKFFCDGTAFFTITDGAGNTANSANCNVTVNVLLDASMISKTDVLCNGLSTGTITVNVDPSADADALSNLSFSKDNGATFQASNVFSGLAAGTYKIVVKSGTSCTSAPVDIEITQPTPLSISIKSFKNPACIGSLTGNIEVEGAGGVGNYTYSINGTDYSTTSLFTGLNANSYTVYVKDGNACTATNNTQTLVDPTITLTSTKPLCPKGKDGTVSLTIVGGNPTKTYSWTGPNGFTATTEDLTGLEAGTYNVTITNVEDNCTETRSVVVPEGVDITLPTPKCKDITVNLSVTNPASVAITAAQIDNGSTDDCSIKSLSLDKTSFSCSDTGVNTVVLTVTDGSDNVATCNAMVTVVDNTPPVATCKPSIKVALNASGSYTLTTSEIDNGSTDNCTINSLNLNKTSFSCSDTGVNTVVLTVTDKSGNVATCNTAVTVIDNTPPVATCKPSITVALNASGSYTLTTSEIDNGSTDNCTINSLNLDKTSFGCSDTGVTNVLLTVTDKSGNVATCNTAVTVVDNTPPVANCKPSFTVALNASGSYTLTIPEINNGSTDNCTINSLNLNKTSFGCSDTGVNTVVLTVTDKSGNVATCNTVVTVVDNTPPTITCPNDINVYLSSGECSSVVYYEKNITYSDNCSAVLTQLGNTALKSGSAFSAGTYILRYRATDPSKNFTDCQFTINVNEYPFTTPIQCKSSTTVQLGNNCVTALSATDLITSASKIGCSDRYKISIDNPTSGQSLVTAEMLGQTKKVYVWDLNGTTCFTNVTIIDKTSPLLICPQDRLITCGQLDNSGSVSPKVSGEPQVYQECSPYVISYEDAVISVPCNTTLSSAPAGFPITKNFNPAYAQNLSKIIVRNFTVRDSSDNKTFCEQVIYIKASSFDDVVWPTDKAVGCTNGYFPTSAKDTTIGGQSYKGTGTPYFSNGLSVDAASCSFSQSYSDKKTYLSGNSGYYLIERTWTLRDNCRNITKSNVQKIVVYDSGISLTCKTGVKLSLSADQTASISSDALVGSIKSECTPLSKIVYGVRKVGAGTGFPSANGLTFSCSEKGNQTVEIWAKDLAGNVTSCVTTITVGDSTITCLDGINGLGFISREDGIPALANINLLPLNLTTTANNGNFEFKNLPSGNTYKVQPNRNDNAINGVTTYDVALITRHILGLNALNSPYKLIAADVNRDGEVDATDILLIRRLILRSINQFPNNSSWRFVPKQFNFDDPNNPFKSDFPEVLVYNNQKVSFNNADFTAIKVGDVNNSALPNPTAVPLSRGTGKKMTLNFTDKRLEAGKVYEIPVRVQTSDKVTAYQFALNIDKSNVDILGAAKGEVANFNEGNYAVFKENGMLTTAWATNAGEELNNNSILKLTLKAHKATNLSDVLRLEPQFTEGVAYDSEGNELNIVLNFDNKIETTAQFELLQNRPNPFNDETVIPFYLPQEDKARLTVYDMTGRVLMEVNRTFAKGYNEVVFKNTATNASSILFYRLQTSTQTGVQKMYFEKSK